MKKYHYYIHTLLCLFITTFLLFTNSRAQDLNLDEALGAEAITVNDEPENTDGTAPNRYIGSSQFFDISGEWVNENVTSKRISKMEITKTIVNTYRLQPYFALGGKELPTQEVPLDISERELVYLGNILEAKCMVMPFTVDNQQKLKVYSIIVNPSGLWTGMATDVMVRRKDAAPKSAQVKTPVAKETAFSAADELAGYWLNEWNNNIIIPRFQLLAEGNKLVKIKLYRMINGKARNIGEYNVVKQDSTDYTQIVEWWDGELKNIMRLRPIRIDGISKGLDMVVEEVYKDGAPKNIFRQFFVKDPEAEKKEAAEIIIKALEGDWVNVNPKSPTTRIHIAESEAELWGRCDSSPDGQCLLVKKELTAMSDDMVGFVAESMSFIRTVEIDVNLDVNKYFKNMPPQVFTISTDIEDMEGIKMPVMITEVFKRKDKLIPREAVGFK
ncbi:hypothetical protein C7N43_01000 [Sphingobacteriales bacterium UPWRP_1]|nr:hypothetical protein B6N25_14380 [Sphingobacteriales bacterium TSM_CSS]PSJ78896.1 hypothetical protein C7N43_01000 [Sphingobacteriales bacterium UPWRP_1]